MAEKLKKLYLNAGQMKAGTTFLYSVLKSHRRIYFSPEKEIHYLSQQYGYFRILSDFVRLRKAKSMTDIANKLDRPIEHYQRIINWTNNYLRPPETPGWYEDMFQGHRDDQWCADFSNLTCTIPPKGLAQVAELADDVRVTYCIRDSVSRAISHAKFHLRFAGVDHDLAAMPADKLKELLLSDNIFPQSRSEDHIAALHQVFGDKRLRIIRCETLWSDPRAVLDPLCDFLEIPPVKGDIRSEAVNVGPSSTMNDDVRQVFEDVFGPLRESNDAMLHRHRNIVIG
ncbi:hypothetical protein FNJ84_03905 [Paracoccus sp. M683]|uniref:sulfotransferase n=1 Tax=Paracoccus sp. M683 TaxID=2594268 RepID=UPI00117F29B2|nr:sulfotransferase [Paracoccus sp. M683]TRW98709.1 hypothetical protein FNJ84_03905 [Paracoccus sp. M683]